MGYRLVGDLAMLVHFGFLVFVVLGGFLAWRWRRLIWVHLVAALWGLATVLLSIRCPLTDVEDWGRERAGAGPLRGTGFIDHYLEDVVYPSRYTGVVQGAAAVVVLVSWVGLLARRRGRRE